MTISAPLIVELAERSYPIYIDSGLLQHGNILSDTAGDNKALVVTNPVIAEHYLNAVMRQLSPDSRSLTLPDGESYKTLDTANRIYDELLQNNYTRDCLLVALGGGVIGDITGFVAATYLRGVDFIQIPTTLLAQVDSSVGGKTAVNHALGKNMIGAFHQPIAVLADTDTLKTLPDREYRAGLAEVIKYGLLGDAEFFSWQEDNLAAILDHDEQALGFLIRRCCENKARIVTEDEKETSERRALLNLGHTFGHAIENLLGYGRLLHGEAVAIGLCMAADLSARMGWISQTDNERCEQLIERAGLPVRVPDNLCPDHMKKCMATDKKALQGQLRLVLMQSIGSALVTADYDAEKLDQTLEIFCREAI